MKRPGPPKRRTPLRRGKSRLKRTRMKRSRGNPVPVDRRIELLQRAQGRCEACAVHHLEDCPGTAEHPHHVAPKGMGGGRVDHSLSNLLAVSGRHHEWVHANPAESYELGLLRRTLVST